MKLYIKVQESLIEWVQFSSYRYIGLFVCLLSVMKKMEALLYGMPL
jgi:hypothetical protein